MEPANKATGSAKLDPTHRPRWQIGLRSLFLLMAALAVWMAVFVNRRENDRLQSRIAVLRPLAHELVINDPTRIAVVKGDELQYDENRWDLYLPAGRYRLCLATRAIDQKGLTPVFKSVPLDQGRHLIALAIKRDPAGWRVEVGLDQAVRLETTEPKAWGPDIGSEGGGNFGLSTQQSVDQPLILFRRRMMRALGNGTSTAPPGPTDGVMLWIEPATGSVAP